jgi:5-methyltetrahydrofolate--homocysteine methyltransferase
MTTKTFIAVGENIHCTRIYKVGGKFCCEQPGGGFAIPYQTAQGKKELLAVPAVFMERADWQAGKVKHCQVAIWQGVQGDADGRRAGVAYLQHLARAQAQTGASYLDLNVDEYSTDTAERVRLMKWLVGVVQEAVSIPMSIDSSNIEILNAGLEAADPARGRPMVNSVSLERGDAIEVSARHRAAVIASAAGETGLPATQEERLGNIERLMGKLRASGFQDSAVHIDPLVFPISTDSLNGARFLETVSDVRKRYGAAIHIVAGLSNISFGMPNRKLINQVFAWLAVQAGADGGIVDTEQINGEILAGLDVESQGFKLAKALLTGADEYGMEYIAAAREGTI